ncbi:hypothetical protein LWI29_003684 [Acer saccharum]|uniref:Uncharacterized protein n=1 Tax=Acer saccharum TaxID=4024 RepID=A0AA39T992_ACESA|nr:hypothetical protein LWI29_003684 [Acer saccharum]
MDDYEFESESYEEAKEDDAGHDESPQVITIVTALPSAGGHRPRTRTSLPDSGYEIDNVQSTVSANMLKILKKTFSIPNTVFLHLPQDNDLPSFPPEDKVTFCADFLGLVSDSLSIHSFVVCFAIIGSPLPSCVLTAGGFCVCSGWYYFHPRPNVSKLILNLPDNNKNWKQKWFLISGSWGGELHEDGVIRSVPTHFGIPVSNSSIAVLRDHEADRVNTLFSVSEQDRDYRSLLDPELLCRLGLSPSFCPKQGEMSRLKRKTPIDAQKELIRLAYEKKASKSPSTSRKIVDLPPISSTVAPTVVLTPQVTSFSQPAPFGQVSSFGHPMPFGQPTSFGSTSQSPSLGGASELSVPFPREPRGDDTPSGYLQRYSQRVMGMTGVEEDSLMAGSVDEVVASFNKMHLQYGFMASHFTESVCKLATEVSHHKQRISFLDDTIKNLERQLQERDTKLMDRDNSIKVLELDRELVEKTVSELKSEKAQ